MLPIHALFAPVLAVFVAAGLLFGTAGISHAQKGEPASPPKIDCSKPQNKKKPACKNQHKELSDDDLFYAGYWLARQGEYELALEYLEQAQNKSDPRILTYIGFALRKLGRIETAMDYYARALAADANYTVARAYLGEAHLQRGDRASAVEQLGEIESRCGTGCDEYAELADSLRKAGAKS